jgi:metallo-beta-lactamase family protein
MVSGEPKRRDASHGLGLGSRATEARGLPGVPVLTFLGAAGTVTGSQFLVETPRARVLVDCGLFQGDKELRLRNRRVFPVDPATIDAIVLTHAHVDHCGRVPLLVRDGFDRDIVVTPDTAALLAIVLPDSGHLQEEEARYASHHGYSKHHPALPLYTEADARRSLERIRELPFDEALTVADGVRVTFRPAGHILGSASVLLELDPGPGGKPVRILFGGDIGRPTHPLLRPPAPLPRVDVVVTESTYGNRIHPDGDPTEALASLVRRTAGRGGTLVVPAFAVDRTEVLLFHLRQLRAEGQIPPLLPIHVDSPMALAALSVYRRALREGHTDVRPELRGGDELLDPGGLHEVRDVDGSKELDRADMPSILISAAGMATGGRVLHHLAARLPDPRSSVALVGFQAAQTRGRQLLDGARQIKMLGRYVPVRAEIAELPAFSVHADRAELIGWLSTAPEPPRQVYVVHGEPAAASALAESIRGELGWNAVVAVDGERVRLD